MGPRAGGADSDPWPEGGQFITEVATGPGGHTWTVWGRSPLDEPTTVRGYVRVIRHPPAFHFGQRSEGFVEVRLHVEGDRSATGASE
jgi:hypothetical protein